MAHVQGKKGKGDNYNEGFKTGFNFTGAALVCTTLLVGIAFSEELKARIKSIDTATNTVVVNNGSQDMPLVVTDKNAISELKAGRLRVGTKMRIKYEKKNGKNVATTFRKMPGC